MRNRVLYVSEDEGAREQLRALLACRGYDVVTAPSLITALLVSRGQAFDLYVVDAHFWGGAGAGLCRTIRVFDPLSPILLVSTGDSGAAGREAYDAGASLYLLRPDIDRLLEGVLNVTSARLPYGGEMGKGVRSRPWRPRPHP